jgi:threonine/homoserine/homoserine lactone efflux protein
MSIYEAIGTAWVIFTSAIATVGILYLAFVGLKTVTNKRQEVQDSEVPAEVKEMFKIAR